MQQLFAAWRVMQRFVLTLLWPMHSCCEFVFIIVSDVTATHPHPHTHPPSVSQGRSVPLAMTNLTIDMTTEKGIQVFELFGD